MTKDPKTGQQGVDKEIVELIKDLSDVKMKKNLGLANIHKFTTAWTDAGIDPENNSEHEMYLNKFCAAFTETAKRLIQEFREKEQKEIIKEANTVLTIASNKKVHAAKGAIVPTGKGQTAFLPSGVNEADLFMGMMSMQSVIQDHKKIDAMATNEQAVDKSRLSLSAEILHHLHFCRTKCEVFCGRDQELAAIKEKISKKRTRRAHHCTWKFGFG